MARRTSPTMWDVARLAGVSQATVSIVLKGDPGSRVSASTVDRVHEAVRTLGYRPNATAKALRERVSELVGFIGDEVASAPFAGEIVEGAQERAWQDGHLLLVVNTGGREDLETAAVEQMLSHQVRRFVYASMYNRPVTLPESLRGQEVVILNAVDPTETTWSVSPDEVEGGRQATQRLLDAGHRRVAMIDIETLESELPAAVGRHQGFVTAMADADVAVDPDLVRFGGGSPEHGYEHASALMELAEPPTAIFCANDRTAWGAYQALQERGLRIPDDVSIIGFDNQETVAPFLRPPLTTMNLPFREMGWAAADLLLTGGAAREGKATTMRLHCDLVERESVAPPRDGA